MAAALAIIQSELTGLLSKCELLLTTLSKYEVTIFNRFSFSVNDIIVLVVFGYIFFTVFNTVLNFIGTTFMPRKSLKSYGEYAVVTGATDGIGKAYALYLAKKGINIVLISRSSEKLKETAAEIEGKLKSKVVIKTIVADFNTSAESNLYTMLKKELGNLNIGILINNVGMSYPATLLMHELPAVGYENLARDIVRLNIISMNEMIKIVLPGMVERRSGAIINISSGAARMDIGSPYLAVYSGSKAYVDYLSRSLHYEARQFGVYVQSQIPYFVTSKLSKIRHTSFTTPNPDGWVRSAATWIGVPNTPSVVPYIPHRIQDFILRNLPVSLQSNIVVNMHTELRRKFLKKESEKKAEKKE
jgi:17beta-estradiol 17-dehydrogenase / very-long-chain 3-oxoacyl-CoA reductase